MFSLLSKYKIKFLYDINYIWYHDGIDDIMFIWIKNVIIIPCSNSNRDCWHSLFINSFGKDINRLIDEIAKLIILPDHDSNLGEW